MEQFPDNGPEGVQSFSEDLINFVLNHREARQKSHPSRLPGYNNSNWVELNLDPQQPVDNYTSFVFNVFEELPTSEKSLQIVILGEFTKINENNRAEEYDLQYFIRANGSVSASIIDASDEEIDEELALRIPRLDNEETKSLIELLQKWMQVNALTQQEGLVIDMPVIPEEI